MSETVKKMLVVIISSKNYCCFKHFKKLSVSYARVETVGELSFYTNFHFKWDEQIKKMLFLYYYFAYLLTNLNFVFIKPSIKY